MHVKQDRKEYVLMHGYGILIEGREVEGENYKRQPFFAILMTFIFINRRRQLNVIQNIDVIGVFLFLVFQQD